MWASAESKPSPMVSREIWVPPDARGLDDVRGSIDAAFGLNRI